MKYLKFAIPVLLVVLIGYLYSCDTNKVTNPSSSDSKEIDGSQVPHDNCLTSPGAPHYCIYLRYNGEPIQNCYNAMVNVTGRVNGNVVYFCSYFEESCESATNLGSKIPPNMDITRTICIQQSPYGELIGTQQFSTYEPVPPEPIYMHLEINNGNVECNYVNQ